MTKTIEEQIAEAREDVMYARVEVMPTDMHKRARLRATERAASRLATLEAVRDGRMIEAYATVAVRQDRGWMTFEWVSDDPDHATSCILEASRAGDTLTVLRGYAHVPSAHVHEVEADYEVPS